MYFVCCIYALLLLNMPAEMAHDWINKSILFYSISSFLVMHLTFQSCDYILNSPNKDLKDHNNSNNRRILMFDT